MSISYYNEIFKILTECVDIRSLTGHRSERKGFHQSVKRKHLISKQDCYNKRNKLKWNTSRHADDAESVNILIKELQSEDYNPILIYKPQGVVDPDVSASKDRFLLAIQTKFQQKMYEQYASTVVCIDSTHKTNVYDFKLITLMVIDEYGEGKLLLIVARTLYIYYCYYY